MKRAYPFSKLYRQKLLERIRALEAQIQDDVKRIAVREAEAREQDRRLERLKREMGVELRVGRRGFKNGRFILCKWRERRLRCPIR